MKHTPTPWRIGKAGGVVSDSAEGLVITGAIGKEAVEYYGGNLIAESVTRDNAAFIVEACNAYENLKRTLDIIREERDGLLREAVTKARDKKSAAQIQHLDSAVRAQASTIAALLQSLKETLDIVHDEICLPLAKIGGGCSIVHTEAKKAIALCEGGAE